VEGRREERIDRLKNELTDRTGHMCVFEECIL
jgi:hypothetical protein